MLMARGDYSLRILLSKKKLMRDGSATHTFGPYFFSGLRLLFLLLFAKSSAIGTIPFDPSDDAGDGGGNSKGVSPASRTTDPNSPPVGLRLAAVHRTRHLRFQENHRHRTGYVDNSLPRVLAHTHCATTTALSLRNPMVDPTRTSVEDDAEHTCKAKCSFTDSPTQ